MADNSGGNAFLGFVLGGIVVVMLLFGLFMYNGGNLSGGKSADIKIEVPKVGTTGSR